MKISFHGAVGEVTGSCSLIETKKKNKYLVDCGMFQGGEEAESKNLEKFKFNPEELSAVFVTHAHLDHVGRLPLLIQGGYKGKIYCTPATAQLAQLILEDALKVMEHNHRKMGTPIVYDISAVNETIQRFTTIDYNLKNIINDDITITLHDAGHIFGSAFIEFEIEKKRIIFSGDIGNTDVPILRDTEQIPDNVDLVICESTYAGRLHEARSNEEREELIENMIVRAINRKGTLMIPSFALERTQQMLYILNELIDRKKKIPKIPIFLDSPLAIHATEVYRLFPKNYNTRASKLYKADDDLFEFPGLTICNTREDSKRINENNGPKIIIAGAGMMNGGRILHHAMRYLSDSNSTLLFIGYQAKGTLGRQIYEGHSRVNIMSHKIPVKCHIEAIGALSAHADQEKILDWLGGGDQLPKRIYFNHGEPDQAQAVKNRIKNELGVKEVEIADEKTLIEI